MIRKIINRLSLLFVLTAAFSSCNKYDDSELQNKVGNLTDRVATVEEWSKTVNSNITSLQGLITAVESNDMITDVADLADKSGYMISFSKSPAIIIKHCTISSNGTNGTDGTDGTNGTNGTNGIDGVTPIIGAAKFDDGFYYWTIKQSDWLLDNQGNKIRITGYDGAPGSPGKDAITPQIKIDEQFKWSVSTDGGVNWVSTGQSATGNTMFTDVKTTATDVTITLADNRGSFTLPLVPTVTIGFDSYEKFMVTPTNNIIKIVLPLSLKSEDYSMIKAEIKSKKGTGFGSTTRSLNNIWGVTLTKPLFTDGVYTNNASVALLPPSDETLEDLAILQVTITDKNGREFNSTRIVTAFNGPIVKVATAGNLAIEYNNTDKTATDLTKLAVIGTMNEEDFKFIRETLVNVKVVDLSQTDITEIPFIAFAYNTKSQAVTAIVEKVVLSNIITSIGEGAFASTRLSGNLTFPNVTLIDMAAFAGCKQLTGIDLPKITSIKQETFFACINLMSINLGNNLTSIAKEAFANCNSLVKITIPRSVISIESGAFNKCDKLTHIKMENPVPIPYISSMFGSGKTILVPDDAAKVAYGEAAGWKDNNHTFVAYN